MVYNDISQLVFYGELVYNFKELLESLILVCFCFGLVLYAPVNSYGHVGMVSSPNHTFYSWASLTKRLTSTLYILSLVTDNNPS